MLLSAPFSGLLTDLYELTMAAGYVQNRFDARATFELFVRNLPQRRNYLVAAGLEQALDFLEAVRFSTEDVSYLRALPFFRNVHSDFFDYLSRFQFTGDVWALPEGTIFFPGEPLLRVTAPIADAQLVETSLLSILHFQTLIASKASRVTTAAAGRPVVEFGSRRAHGMENECVVILYLPPMPRGRVRTEPAREAIYRGGETPAHDRVTPRDRIRAESTVRFRQPLNHA